MKINKIEQKFGNLEKFLLHNDKIRTLTTTKHQINEEESVIESKYYQLLHKCYLTSNGKQFKQLPHLVSINVF